MAIWQCDYYLVPESAVAKRSGLIPTEISKQQFRKLDLGRKPWCPADYAKQLDELLPEFPSWASWLRWWGTEEGDRIDVSQHKTGVDSIFIRFDLRKINAVLIRRLADLARDWKCVFCSSESLHLVRATGPSILQSIAESHTLRSAWRWFGTNVESSEIAEIRQVFICHSSKDKAFVRTLANDLKAHGVPVWFDEWSLKLGDSLTEKIQDGIQSSGWLLVVLSKNSVRSGWARRELNAGLALELEKNRIYILPVRIDSCRLPIFLRDRLYADFRKPYRVGLDLILRRVTA